MQRAVFTEDVSVPIAGRTVGIVGQRGALVLLLVLVMGCGGGEEYALEDGELDETDMAADALSTNPNLKFWMYDGANTSPEIQMVAGWSTGLMLADRDVWTGDQYHPIHGQEQYLGPAGPPASWAPYEAALVKAKERRLKVFVNVSTLFFPGLKFCGVEEAKRAWQRFAPLFYKYKDSIEAFVVIDGANSDLVTCSTIVNGVARTCKENLEALPNVIATTKFQKTFGGKSERVYPSPKLAVYFESRVADRYPAFSDRDLPNNYHYIGTSNFWVDTFDKFIYDYLDSKLWTMEHVPSNPNIKRSILMTQKASIFVGLFQQDDYKTITSNLAPALNYALTHTRVAGLDLYRWSNSGSTRYPYVGVGNLNVIRTWAEAYGAAFKIGRLSVPPQALLRSTSDDVPVNADAAATKLFDALLFVAPTAEQKTTVINAMNGASGGLKKGVNAILNPAIFADGIRLSHTARDLSRRLCVSSLNGISVSKSVSDSGIPMPVDPARTPLEPTQAAVETIAQSIGRGQVAQTIVNIFNPKTAAKTCGLKTTTSAMSQKK